MSTDLFQSTGLFHVTPSRNKRWIEKQGIRPDKSKGQRLVSWYVTSDMLMWALAHVSKRHNLPTRAIAVVALSWDIVEIEHTRWSGVYTCAYPVTTELGTWYSAHQVLDWRRSLADTQIEDFPF